MHGIILPTFGLAIHTALMIYIIIGLAILFAIMSGRLKIIPGKFQSILEIVVEGFEGLVAENMGPKGKKYLPFILTIAIFVFVGNALGMIPGFLPPTANINCPAGIAVVVFLLTHIVGIKEHGFKYIKHFTGPIWWMTPLMLPLELIGHLARPVSLTLRLFGNMMGHEQIVGVLLVLMPIAYPLLAFSTVLGVIVVLVQSFVFALLAMLYIGGALEEAH